MIESIVKQAPFFLLVAVRCLALFLTMPLMATRAVSHTARVALAGYTAFLMLPFSYSAGWIMTPFSLSFLLLLIGEALIGIIIGFYISLIFAAFSSAGQFFTYQMGFGASEVYDALSQVENPLMGQFLNLIAFLLFIQTKGFQKIFIIGIKGSLESFNAYSLVQGREFFIKFLISGLTSLFLDAMIIALPMVGTLFLISVSMGILSKAAPQMNLLSEGLPISILTAFLILTFLLPYMADLFIRSFGLSFNKIEQLLLNMLPFKALTSGGAV